MSIEARWKGENYMLEIIVNAAVILTDIALNEYWCKYQGKAAGA